MLSLPNGHRPKEKVKGKSKLCHTPCKDKSFKTRCLVKLLPFQGVLLLSFFFQFLLQSDDFVAILCGLHEVEVLGCLLHQGGGIGDALLQFLPAHAADDRVGNHRGAVRFDVNSLFRSISSLNSAE